MQKYKIKKSKNLKEALKNFKEAFDKANFTPDSINIDIVPKGFKRNIN